MIIMKDEGFKCLADNYVLCLTCVAKKPAYFVGNLSELAKSPTDPSQGMTSEEPELDYTAAFKGYAG